ncbi:MAG: hypothetical protein LBT04_09140 [Prevotellaceae bacterium]|jgi:hypothetical protein|nr:hypothetical protein [Prevotellaceae bacterium]
MSIIKEILEGSMENGYDFATSCELRDCAAHISYHAIYENKGVRFVCKYTASPCVEFIHRVGYHSINRQNYEVEVTTDVLSFDFARLHCGEIDTELDMAARSKWREQHLDLLKSRMEKEEERQKREKERVKQQIGIQ